MTRDRDERGAVTLMVALFVVVFAVLSAFAVDLGMAYASKRQLQTAADSASLAAASVYAQHVDECDDPTLAAHEAPARAEAQAHVTANASTLQQDLTVDDFDSACTTGGELVVTVGVSADTAAVFGGLTGTGDTISTSRTATAAVDVPPGGPGVKPLAICASELPVDIEAGDAWRVNAPGNGHTPPAGCPVDKKGPSGNWWTLDCPGDLPGGNGTGGLEQQIEFGCDNPIEIVSPSVGLSPEERSEMLAARCAGASISPPYECISGDPGQPDAGHARDAWRAVVDEADRVMFPVFCAPPHCSEPSLWGEGTNAVFAVHRVVTATVCGYHFGKQADRRYAIAPGNPDCDVIAADVAALKADNSDANYLLLSFQHLQVSGGTASFDCALGDDLCDGGARRVRLVE